jgi:hypothetical protein
MSNVSSHWSMSGIVRSIFWVVSRNHFEQGLAYIEKLLEKTRVFKITIAKLSGKARKT